MLVIKYSVYRNDSLTELTRQPFNSFPPTLNRLREDNVYKIFGSGNIHVRTHEETGIHGQRVR